MAIAKAISLIKTCEACPSQWEGTLDDGRNFYIRYRWGYLSLRFSEEPGGDAVGGPEAYGKTLDSSGWDGTLDDARMKMYTGHAVDWTEV